MNAKQEQLTAARLAENYKFGKKVILGNIELCSSLL